MVTSDDWYVGSDGEIVYKCSCGHEVLEGEEHQCGVRDCVSLGLEPKGSIASFSSLFHYADLFRRLTKDLWHNQYTNYHVPRDTEKPRIDKNKAEMISFEDMVRVVSRRNSEKAGYTHVAEPHEDQNETIALQHERWASMDKVRDIYKEENDGDL